MHGAKVKIYGCFVS